jgi:threonine/homoserine/homoserine lactone efflux protein
VGFELVIHSIFASVGLSALLAQSAVASSVVKYVGAPYLIYLGIKAFGAEKASPCRRKRHR